MSLDTTAKLVAERIACQDSVDVYAHHDADGIATAGILCHAMARTGTRFRLRIVSELLPSCFDGSAAKLLCDLGSGMENLPKDVMVVDHHIPRFDGEFQVNPRFDGIDGDRELCSAGTAYLVAQKLGDNRDLAGLAIIGMIGDHQEPVGKNHAILNEATGNAIVTPSRGICLPGREIAEQLILATSPYLAGISGEEKLIRAFVSAAVGTDHPRLDLLLSQVILHAGPDATVSALRAMYGDTYQLGREVIQDAHGLAAVIDACGKTGNGGLGASLCLRSSADLPAAWDVTRAYRLAVIRAIRSLPATPEATSVFEVQDAFTASDVADILITNPGYPSPLVVLARSGERCRISARAREAQGTGLGTIIHDLAGACGGSGGGHRTRAGATISWNQADIFRTGWTKAVAS